MLDGEALTFNEYQVRTRDTAIYPTIGHPVVYPALECGEIGEVLNKVKKIFRDDNGVLTEKRREEIKKELGGALYAIASLCFEMGVPLGDVAAQNINILASRKERGTIKGDGDNR